MLYQIQKALGYQNRTISYAINTIRRTLLCHCNFPRLREPKVKASIPHDPRIQEEITGLLKPHGFNVGDFRIDVDDYKRYMRSSGYDRFPGYYDAGRAAIMIEKSLEHYLALKLLDISASDVYIDIANAGSPVPEIYHELCGCSAYRQDILFRKAIQGNVIGGDAGRMPVEDGFATKMALHCSFEDFEQDSDIRFIKEASRVLRKGGNFAYYPYTSSINMQYKRTQAFCQEGAYPLKRMLCYIMQKVGTIGMAASMMFLISFPGSRTT